MTNESHRLVRDFLKSIAIGKLPENLVTPDMTAWTLTSGESDKERFAGGIKMLAAIFKGTLVYDIDSLTAEENRVVAEVRSKGTLTSGEDFRNVHVFAFTLCDGKISAVREYMNPVVVGEKIVPLMKELMAKNNN